MKFLASLSSTLFAAVVIAAPALAQPSKATETLRIGYQKYGSADLVYVANQPPAPAAEAIVVPKDSPLKSVAGGFCQRRKIRRPFRSGRASRALTDLIQAPRPR